MCTILITVSDGFIEKSGASIQNEYLLIHTNIAA